MSKEYWYNIHHLITIRSQVKLPELAPFIDEREPAWIDIDVLIGHPSPISRRSGGRHIYYSEIGLLGFAADIEMGECIEVVAGPMLRFSPHVLYTNLIEPILRWKFVSIGYALVHGATLAIGDRAYLITARTDTGKTTTLLKILNHQRRDSDKAAFVSDDLTVVSPLGQVLSYPKPMTISAHTVKAVNTTALSLGEKLALIIQSRIHSRGGRKFAFLLNRIKFLPVATINMIVQMIIPPPKYSVQRLVQTVKLARFSQLAGLFIIEKGGEICQALDQENALTMLLANCEDAFGFPPYKSLQPFLSHMGGRDLCPEEHEIIRRAFEPLPANLIRSASLEWWRRIPAFMGEEISSSFEPRVQQRAVFNLNPDGNN